MVTSIDPNTVLQNFNGMSFFQLFRDQEDYFNMLMDHIKDNDLAN